MNAGPLEALLERWEGEARVLNRLGHEREAGDVKRRIEELHDALSQSREEKDAEWLGIAGAEEWSGYSRDRLRELAQEGWVEARKVGRRWRFLRSALPRKPTPPSPDPDEDLRPSERAARRALEVSD